MVQLLKLIKFLAEFLFVARISVSECKAIVIFIVHRVQRYRLFQNADLICVFPLLRINQAQLVISLRQFLDSSFKELL